MQEQERGDVPSAAGGQRSVGPQQECTRSGGWVRGELGAAGAAGADAAPATGRRSSSERVEQQRVLREAAFISWTAGTAAEDRHTGVNIGAAEVLRVILALALPPSTRLPSG